MVWNFPKLGARSLCFVTPQNLSPGLRRILPTKLISLSGFPPPIYLFSLSSYPPFFSSSLFPFLSLLSSYYI